MKKMNRTQKSWMIIGLCLIVLFMAIGYASFATDLTITGSSNITSTWDIRITDIKVKSFTGGATKAEEPTVTSNTTATFKTNLVSPGDSMTYTVTVANEGNISARLDDMTVSDENNPAILFQITEISENDVLGEHSNTTFDVTVTYNPDVTSQPADLNSTLEVALDYVQNN